MVVTQTRVEKLKVVRKVQIMNKFLSRANASVSGLNTGYKRKGRVKYNFKSLATGKMEKTEEESGLEGYQLWA